jgi:hypothetical protein
MAATITKHAMIRIIKVLREGDAGVGKSSAAEVPRHLPASFGAGWLVPISATVELP